MELTNPDQEQSLSQTQYSRDSFIDEGLKQSFDKVMRGLLSEVDDQRRVFDKKWQSLAQYLMRKHEDQESLIRKLKAKLGYYEQLQSNNPENQDRDQEGSKRVSDAGAKGAVPCSPVKEKPLAEEEDIDDFDQLQSIISERSNGSPFRKRRFYSVGNLVQPKALVVRKDSSNVQAIQKRPSMRSSIIMPKNESDFIGELKSNLLKANAIIKRDYHQKMQLITKMKEMKEQLDALKQIQGNDIPVEGLLKQNKKIQTEEIENVVNDQMDRHSIGVNTESFELDYTKVKISPDQIEEHRLKQNIQFWKSKVDQLLQKQKETLHTHLMQQKQLSTYELQVEELKQLLRVKEDQVDSLQISKNMLEQRTSLLELLEDKEQFMIDKIGREENYNDSSEVVNESAHQVKNNPQKWTKSEIPSSQASSIDHRHSNLAHSTFHQRRQSNGNKDFYSPLDNSRSKKSSFQSVNKNAQKSQHQHLANTKAMYTVDLSQKKGGVIKPTLKLEKTRQEIYERSKTPSNDNMTQRTIDTHTKQGTSRNHLKNNVSNHKSQSNLLPKKQTPFHHNHSRKASKGKPKMNKSILSSQKMSDPDSIKEAIRHTVSLLNYEQMNGTYDKRDDHNTDREILDIISTGEQERATPLKMRNILEAFRASHDTPLNLVSNAKSPPKALQNRNHNSHIQMSGLKQQQQQKSGTKTTTAKALRQSYSKMTNAQVSSTTTNKHGKTSLNTSTNNNSNVACNSQYINTSTLQDQNHHQVHRKFLSPQ